MEIRKREAQLTLTRIIGVGAEKLSFVKATASLSVPLQSFHRLLPTVRVRIDRDGHAVAASRASCRDPERTSSLHWPAPSGIARPWDPKELRQSLTN